MNYKVVITESAYQDIDYILVFIVARAGSTASARSFLDRWSSIFNKLSEFLVVHPLNYPLELKRLFHYMCFAALL
jgi:plasmid stabilization system protein ParE